MNSFKLQLGVRLDGLRSDRINGQIIYNSQYAFFKVRSKRVKSSIVSSMNY